MGKSPVLIESVPLPEKQSISSHSVFHATLLALLSSNNTLPARGFVCMRVRMRFGGWACICSAQVVHHRVARARDKREKQADNRILVATKQRKQRPHLGTEAFERKPEAASKQADARRGCIPVRRSYTKTRECSSTMASFLREAEMSRQRIGSRCSTSLIGKRLSIKILSTCPFFRPTSRPCQSVCVCVCVCVCDRCGCLLVDCVCLCLVVPFVLFVEKGKGVEHEVVTSRPVGPPTTRM